MRDYFLRRFLLIPPTLLGVTLLVFALTRILPGGPVEKAMQAAAVRAMSERGGGGRDAGATLSDEQKEQIKELYGFDKPFYHAYAVWLGIWPREVDKVRATFAPGLDAVPVLLRTLLPRSQWTPTSAYAVQDATLHKDGTLTTSSGAVPDGWKVRLESFDGKAGASVYRHRFDGVLEGNLGLSTRYNMPVAQMMTARLPISFFYGFVTLILSYSVCLPLGIVKAIRHRTLVDNLSSILIFAGYAVPAFALGSLLVVFVAGRLGWFPIGGFVSENFSALSAWGKVKDVFDHAALPLVCYLVGEFALLTMLMKNNLMDNLAADYVRTATAKGASFRRAVFVHAVRNSLIPVATTLGHHVAYFVGGSILIERIFDIDGFGLLSLTSLVDRDFPLAMGTLVLSSVAMMLGNILSDFLVAVLDPRIRFT